MRSIAANTLYKKPQRHDACAGGNAAGAGNMNLGNAGGAGNMNALSASTGDVIWSSPYGSVEGAASVAVNPGAGSTVLPLLP